MLINEMSIPEHTVAVPVGRHRVDPVAGGLRDVGVTGVQHLDLAIVKFVTRFHKVLNSSRVLLNI